MVRAAIVLVLAVFLLLQISPPTHAPRATADHEDGHLAVNGLLKRLIEGVGGAPSPPTLCGPEFPISTQAAAQNWKNTAGTGGGNVIDIFTYQTSCTGADVIVTTSGLPPGCAGSHACVPLTQANDYGLVMPIYVYMNPSVFHTVPTSPTDLYGDGRSHTTRDITHELGHALGFDDYCPDADPCFAPTFCPNGQLTIIDTKEKCLDPATGQLPLVPQALDIDNYHKAYKADAVTFFTGYPSALNQVTFNWNPSNVHNERAFLVNWLNPCIGGGQWQIAGVALKNESTVTLPGQQGGPQQYEILPLTFADPDDNFGGGIASTEPVTVDSSLAAPTGVTSSLLSTYENLVSWNPVPGADHYHLRTSSSPFGNFNCSNAISATQFDIAPSADYHRVMACTAPPSDLCSPMSLLKGVY